MGSRRHSRVLKPVHVCNLQINIDTLNQTFEMRLCLQAILPVDAVCSTSPHPSLTATRMQICLVCASLMAD